MSLLKCLSCGNLERNRTHVAREMFYGMKGQFTYIECDSCGSLSIETIPRNLADYYDSRQYYSHLGSSFLRRRLLDIRAKHFLKRPSFLGGLLTRAFGKPNLWWIHDLSIARSDPILDVGCGSGEILRDLQAAGFQDLTGVDPYARGNSSPQIIPVALPESPRREYKLVMMHHALEHCEDPRSILREMKLRLMRDGVVLVRIPLAQKLAWRRYGVNWYQLDAPRHLCIFSEEAFRNAAHDSGFRIVRVVFDSSPGQFIASEGYVRNVPLVKQRRPAKAELEKYTNLTAEVNRVGDGDQACFILTHLDGNS